MERIIDFIGFILPIFCEIFLFYILLPKFVLDNKEILNDIDIFRKV